VVARRFSVERAKYSVLVGPSSRNADLLTANFRVAD
jgi:hypothetical protein